MNIALYAGSFDPFTLGHLDIVKRSSIIFDKTVVAIMKNPFKKELFTASERAKMIERCLKQELSDYEYDVLEFDGLTVDAAEKSGAKTLIRGIRNSGEIIYELQMEKMNKVLAPDLEVVYFSASLEYEHISSSLVKEIATLGRDVGAFLPESIEHELTKKLSVCKMNIE